MELILCSGSKTRAKLLRDGGFQFQQVTPPFDEEQIDTKDPYLFPLLAAYGKFKKCRELFDRPFLTADTVVTDGVEIFRKAKSVEEARQLLLKQSGREIRIVTGVWVQLPNRKIESFLDETIYLFQEFDRRELEEFLASGEWEGKAGACIVEGFCGRFVKKVVGFQSTAMGLPLEWLKGLLENYRG
ncbi:MAG: septum formation inhibitor Maf, partial [Campylobacterales bacterium]